MRTLKHLTTWLLLLTVFLASGVVSAKVASGVQNLSGGLHQAETGFNSLIRRAKIGFSYDAASGSPVAPNRTAGSIRNVNPTKGTQNCVNCSVATDATLAGRPASALSGSPTSIRALEKHFGGSFGSAISRSGIENQMLNAGSGARGIVFGSRGSQTGHVFNVVNQKGAIRFLDGQTGKPASFDGFQNLHLLRTN